MSSMFQKNRAIRVLIIRAYNLCHPCAINVCYKTKKPPDARMALCFCMYLFLISISFDGATGRSYPFYCA